MQSQRISYIYILLIAVICTACGISDHNISTNSGLVSIDYEVTGTYYAADGTQMAVPVAPNERFVFTITDTNTGLQHTWTSADSLPLRTLLANGAYHVSLTVGTPSDPYTPTYTAHNAIEVLNQNVEARLVAHLAKTLTSVHIADAVLEAFPEAKALLHVDGGRYIEAVSDQLIFMPEGQQRLYIQLSPNTVLRAPTTYDTQAEREYMWNVDLDGNHLIINDNALDVSPAALAAAAPTVEPSGFTPGQTLTVIEGEDPPGDVGFTVTAPSALSALQLSLTPLTDNAAQAEGTMGEINLLEQQHQLVEVIKTATGYTVMVDALLASVRPQQELQYAVSLMAVDRSGRACEPVALNVVAKPVDFYIVSSTPAILGTNVAQATIQAANQLNIEGLAVQYEYNGQWIKADNLLVSQPDADSTVYTLQFTLPLGRENVPARLYYYNQLVAEGEIERRAPEYSLKIDAMSSALYLTVESPAGPEAAQQIAALLTPYINGQEAIVTFRDVENAGLAINGLKPETTYTLTSTPLAGNPNAVMSPAIRFTTETATQVPEGDFENAIETINLDHIPQGGRYSLTAAPIFNYQNETDFTIFAPRKSWATTNAKTLCQQAANRNTWYMQPSARCDYDQYQSGAKAMLIQSVGWDLNGPEIAPYAQQPGQPVIQYNANVPPVAHRSAGRLFLGEYRFNPATLHEEYVEGVSFTSRPLVFNGFYKYQPSPNNPGDKGYVRIALEDAEGNIVAQGQAQLDPAPGYRAFAVDLEYASAFMRPKLLKIMFCSTVDFGDIEHEDANVRVAVDLPSSRYIGSQLWVDNLYFTY